MEGTYDADYCGNLEDNLRDAVKLSWYKAKSGPEASQWTAAGADEFDRLVATKTIKFVCRTEMPAGQRAAHLNHVLKRKMAADGSTTYRVRATIRGDQIRYEGEKSAWTVAQPIVKLFLSAAVTEVADVATCDISDFYLNSKLPRSEWMRVHRSQLPNATINKYKLEPLFDNDYVYCRVDQTIYGLPQAGKLAQDRLVEHLAKFGFKMADHTDCLFSHESRKISFLLYVDDFLIKFKQEADLEFLFSTLRQLYEIKTDRQAKKFLGISLHFDRPTKSVTLSVPGYVRSLAERFKVDVGRRVDSPLLPPDKKQRYVVEDKTAPLNEADTKLLQQIVGAVLWYAKSVDCTMLAAVSKIAGFLGSPTQKTLADARHMLAYAVSHPDAQLVLYASDMQLCIHSDASFNAEPGARSRLAGYYFLGSGRDPSLPPNGAVDTMSSKSKIILTSVHNAEYEAMFKNTERAHRLRFSLLDLGYPQGPTTITADNEKTVEHVNGLVRSRKTNIENLHILKVKELVQDGIFKIIWRPGTENLADLLTKAHPANHHNAVRHLYVRDPAPTSADPALPSS